MTSHINQANIGFNENGTPFSLEFDDVYFSNNNGLEESRYVFVEGNDLSQKWQQFDHIHVAETGFGTGLNFFTAWQTLLEQRETDRSLSMTFTSFEKYPLSKADLTAALKCWPEVQEFAEQLLKHYPEKVDQDLTLQFCSTAENKQFKISLNILVGDVNERIDDLINNFPKVNAWFLDGFAPSKNPDMWTQTLFNGMAQSCNNEATVATFTAAGFVRRGLIEAGFNMAKRKGFGHKREMLVGRINSGL
ncbi:MAG: tRNA (5-methylaminomethyl-2-thiouridine)(34)-methyltransferase MnmD [Gammaproteobacteria bacterium]|nr:tRNA (5-methylaminomethyl-2-thiouridine)(34)-methyltransferase MnmD [Gammaproteobacteria bacterium]